MRLLLYSDLHNEFQPFVPPAAAVAAADVVVLAGDVDDAGRLGGRSDWKAVAWAQQHCQDKPVVLVAGNHEFYGGRFHRTLQKMRDATAGTNVHLLENDALVLSGASGGVPVRFLGCTLWTDMRLHHDHLDVNASMEEFMPGWRRYELERRINDYRKVREDRAGYRRLRVTDVMGRHRVSRTWLEQQLGQPFDGKTVVVTHHGPSRACIAQRHLDHPRHGPLSICYASNLDHLVQPPVDLWMHGHLHDSVDMHLNGVRVVCNPRGYAPDHLNPDFNPWMLVEV